MTVSSLEPLDRKKCKVFLDGDFAFVLYRGELDRFHIEAGAELPEELLPEIRRLLAERAREQMLYYLGPAPRTEAEVRRKLRENLYPEETAEETACWLRRNGLLDDEAYIRNFMEIYGSRRSRAQMERFLVRKGLSLSLIREAASSVETEKPENLIAYFIEKRHFDARCADDREKRRMLAYLQRRGFRTEEIRRAAPDLLRTGGRTDFC